MKKFFFLLITSVSLFTACVGTDELDDGAPVAELTTADLEIDPASIGLMVDETEQFEYIYTIYKGDLGVVTSGTATWTSDDLTIAEISQDGLLTAKGLGSTNIRLMVDSLEAVAVVTVVGDTNSTAEVKIVTPSKTSFQINDKLQLEAQALNISGSTLNDKVITWESSNPAVISVNATGEITALVSGEALITAKTDSVSSATLSLEVQSASKTATFSGSGSYTVTGTATMFYNESDDLILEFSNDFSVSSFGAAIYVYLSNQDNSVAGGAEIQQLTKQGGQSYNLTTINSSLTIDSYDYVIIHCKPFNIPFGQSSKLQ